MDSFGGTRAGRVTRILLLKVSFYFFIMCIWVCLGEGLNSVTEEAEEGAGSL